MNKPEYYYEIAKICVSTMIREMTTSMQRYNSCVGRDNRSAGLHRNDVYRLTQLLTECGFKPNIKEAEATRDGIQYIMYQSLDFNDCVQELKDMGIIVGVAGTGIHEFAY